MSHYKQYPAYKDSNIPEISLIPEGWSIKRLKHHADFFNSNIDKKSYEDGIPTQLCNYTDVYYNEFISPDLPFMEATASESEIQRFTLKAGDVIITKDSEDPWDIGVPAMVKEDMPGVVCGYHLTMIRAKDLHTSRFIHRLLQSLPVKSYLAVNSPGVTRFGLGQDVIGSLPVPTPPAELFKTIADKIDRETSRIDALIAKKTRFIELLKEKRQALITHAVTKGLNPNVKMKDSWVEWIGEVPEHWSIKPLGYGLDAIGDVDHYMPPSVECGVPYLMTGDLRELSSQVDFESCKKVTTEDYDKLSKKIKTSSGDIVIARYATIGTSMYVDSDIDFLVSYSCVTAKAKPSELSGKYLFLYMKSHSFNEGLSAYVNTGTQGNVGIGDLKKVKITFPPIDEQNQIIDYLANNLQRIDGLLEKSNRSIDLLKERRSAFITAAVTGQIDLRSEARQ